MGLSDDEEEEEDRSIFEAVLSPDCRDVRLRRERPEQRQKKKIRITEEMLKGELDDISNWSDDDLDEILSPSLGSPDELEDSILERLEEASPMSNVGGVERRIDMKVIEPYKRVLSHGGYLTSGAHNAIVVFSACYLPHHSRLDYTYVMDNLFGYILSTLDQLITDDYVLVYLHGGTAKDCVPPFSWLKRCYRTIDRKLRKNLKRLYMVHPTFWLKTIVLMTRPFVSSKFSRKIQFVNSLSELYETIPVEQASIPDRVHQYDRLKQSIQQNK
ncbi:hypothetical protein AAG570_013446 [Ranatra chinensis]|uniref:CRAL-TRIO domain-containing protein n=1 Tax=Ranatra chinensis TaxID=642074 RepID=A0ABD0YCD6_9HEMI